MIYIGGNIMQELEKLKKLFYEIKNKDWIEGYDNNYGSIGNTFEKMIGIPTNELEISDFKNIEIKTKTKYNDPYIALFNCAQTGLHYHKIERLKNIYVYPDSVLKCIMF